MKKMLKSTKDKLNHIVEENPDLFDGVSDDTNARIDQLIETVRNQAAQITYLQQDREVLTQR